MLKNISFFEKSALAYAAITMLVGFVWSYADHDSFENIYVIEDGFIEWSTFVFLVLGLGFSLRRFWLLKAQRSITFLFMVALLALLFFFGAGEEISWGQRIFHVQSSEFFIEHNAQGEMNLHNLIVNDTKINKVIFGRGLGLMLLLYLFVLVPLYKSKEGVKQVIDKFAIPIAQNYQIIAYVLLLVVVQGLMVSSKKGEILESTGAIIFLLNVMYPYNKLLFKSK